MFMFRSPLPDVTIPVVPLTDFVLGDAARFGDKPALIDGPTGRTITYTQLAQAVERVAAGLAARGLRKGDVVAVYSPNLPEYAIAFHGTLRAGGIVTTANPLYTVEELTHQLNDAGATFLITIPPLLETALAAAQQSNVREVFVFGEAEGATPFAALLQSEGAAPNVEIDPREDVAVLPYSSGTTGLPKGVMLTHYNLVSNLCQIAALEPLTPDDVLIGILPFFHIYGMIVILNSALNNGATVVSMPRFDLVQFLELMQKHRVTRAHLVPPVVLALAKHPIVDQYDLSALRMIMSGAAPLGEELAVAVSERLGCKVKQAYGMTEASPATHITPDDRIKPAAVGVLVPNTEARIVDPATGQDVGVGERGEIWIRGPQVMKGYLNRPDATAATVDAEGWLHTGDVGYADEDGYFYIVDRVKELIKYKGYQVAPAELEAVLLSHPAVADAAVIPVPDEEAGEIPKAFVVKKADVDADELMAYVAEHVAPYKKVREIEFVESIPKSASGKILRRVLVEQERARRAR
ncbi:hypothetical protein SE16_13620 [Ardenticatena maritima]|uniref:AMP-dependent synthetase n=2 Tax=Ardenticatena maritima TaxID=872965 RepID=A0A0P6YM72_9CHLR|nr:hypothetical protein SE16_13620 [Ardenticatena maritima]